MTTTTRYSAKIIEHAPWERPTKSPNAVKVEVHDTKLGHAWAMWLDPDTNDVLNRHGFVMSPAHYPDIVMAVRRAR